MAWAVARTAMPGRQFVRVAALIAFVIPNFISVIAWILLLGPNAGLINVLVRDTFGVAGAFNIYSMSGLILVLTFSFYPLIFFAVTAALDNMDPAYEEAAQMAGASAWRASLGVAMPLVLPAILSSSVFVFLEAMGAFGAPAAIGHGARFHTLTTKIYELFSYPPRFELAAAAAAPIIGFTVLGLLLQRSCSAAGASPSSAASVARRARSRSAPALAAVRLVHAGDLRERGPAASDSPAHLAAGALGAGVFLANLTLQELRCAHESLDYRSDGFVNSRSSRRWRRAPAWSSPSIIVWIVERTSLPGRGLLTFISTVTFAFPGVALAVGFVLGYSAEPLALFGTIWLLFIAFTAHRFPFAFMFLRNSVKQLSSDMEEAARVSAHPGGARSSTSRRRSSRPASSPPG